MSVRVVTIRFDSADARRAAAEAAAAFRSAIDSVNRTVGGGPGGGLGGADRAFRNISGAITSAGQALQRTGVALSAFSASIVGVGRAAVQSAVQIDRQVNTLKALTGSAETAERRFAQLVATAQKTPGLTASLAATLDAQLRVANVTETTIDRILPAVGRLNAISPLGDPQRFAQNLVQLVTQNFEKTDLKELVGQSPLAGEIIKQVFNVDSPTNSKAIRESAKKLGLTSTDAFFSAFAEAARNNPKLANVTESLGTQFDKLRDRIIVALRPLGLQIIQTLGPLVEQLVPFIERISTAFGKLPESARQAIVVLGVLTATLGPLVFAFGGLVSTLGSVAGAVGGLAGAGGIGAAVAGGASLSALIPPLAVVTAGVVGLGLAFATNFGGIREVAGDAVGFIVEQFGRFKDVLEENRGLIGQFKEIFKNFSDTVKPIVREFWDFFRETAETALGGVLKALNFTLKETARLLNLARQGATNLRENVGLSGTTILRSFVDPVGALGDFVFGDSSRRVTAEDIARARGTGQGLDGEEVTQGQMSEALERQRLAGLEKKNKNTIESEKKKDSELRAIRQAQLNFEREIINEQTKLEQDRIKRSIEDNEFEFEQKRKSFGAFFVERRRLNEELINIEIQGIRNELAESLTARESQKKGSAEYIRLQTEILRLQNDLVLKQRELGRVAIDNGREFQKQLEAILVTNGNFNGLGQRLAGAAGEVIEGRTLDPIERAFGITQQRESQRNTGIDEQIKQNRIQSLEFQRQEAEIQNQVARGVITEAQGRQEILGLQRQIAELEVVRLQQLESLQTDPEKIAEIRLEIERLRNVGRDLSPAEAFFKGLSNETELLSEKLTNLGRNFRDTFVDSFTELLVSGRNTFGNLFNVVKTAIARMTAELIASQLFRFFAGGATSGGNGGPAGSAAGGGNAGVGGVLGGILGSIFGGGRSGGGGGFGGFGGFGTPPFNPNFATAGGGTSAGPADLLNSAILLGTGGISQARGSVASGGSATRGGGFGSIFGQFGSNLSNLFKGIGFGKAPGSAGGLAGALPLLGLTFGAGAGGSSILGQILGGAGGALLGVGLTAAPSALAGTFLAPLFSNPITAIVGAGLLVGSIFLGRASQRRKDEEASGDFLQQAIDGIAQLREAVSTDQITGAQARAAFNSDILGTFRAQINTLKTKSVRESRLTNQVRDLQNLFESSVGPEITKQAERNRVGSRLIPEFSGGGRVPGIDLGYDSVLARVTPGEVYLNRQQQANVAAISGMPNIFQAAGVPNTGSISADGFQAFAGGGTAVPQPQEIVIGADLFEGANLTLAISQGDVTRLLLTPAARKATATNVKRSRQARRLR